MFQYKFTILLALLIALLSLIPGNSMPGSFLWAIPHIDKIIHMAMYGSLGFVGLIECRKTSGPWVLHFLLLFFVFTLSALIEILQATVVATRAAEWYDLLANFLGLVAAYFAYRLIGSWRLFNFLRS